MSNGVNQSIFEDLEIDIELIKSDPKEFSVEVYRAAKKLEDVLDQNNSISETRAEAKAVAAKNLKAQQLVTTKYEGRFDDMFQEAETMPLDELYYFIQEVKELAKSLEITFDSRSINEKLMQSHTITDKKLALAQYKSLREAFEAFRNFAKIFHSELVLAPLKAKSGNYGSNHSKFPAFRIGEDIYHNYRAVARKLGLNPEDFKSHMDMVEYLEKNDVDDVTTVEVEL